MARKSKDEELDFFFLNEGERITSNKQKKKNKKIKKKKTSANKNVGLADNEIIIGVNTKPINKTKVSKNNKSKNKKETFKTNKVKTRQNNNNNNRNNTKKKDKLKKERDRIEIDKNKKKKNKILLLLKVIIPILLLGILIAYLITSPIFNISEVEVLGNNKITSDTYLSLSKITLGNNIFNLSKKEIIQNIKENPYVDTVQVKRKLPNKIEITVTERNATYMLKILNSYAYINNQGYILESNREIVNTPVITGFSTSQEEIVPGNRLNMDDLSKLEMVLKIMDTIAISGITEIVNEINISDKNNYTLIFTEEGKTAYIGDGSNLTDRINIYLKAILQNEKGKSGEIFINGDINQDKVYFREKV